MTAPPAYLGWHFKHDVIAPLHLVGCVNERLRVVNPKRIVESFGHLERPAADRTSNVDCPPCGPRGFKGHEQFRLPIRWDREKTRISLATHDHTDATKHV
jgi:hypothetical protein